MVRIRTPERQIIGSQYVIGIGLKGLEGGITAGS
jgi:hypothetical protein